MCETKIKHVGGHEERGTCYVKIGIDACFGKEYVMWGETLHSVFASGKLLTRPIHPFSSWMCADDERFVTFGLNWELGFHLSSSLR